MDATAAEFPKLHGAANIAGIALGKGEITESIVRDFNRRKWLFKLTTSPGSTGLAADVGYQFDWHYALHAR
jgi:hypothetical protein